MKVVLNTPDLSSKGGVSNHYLGLKNKFSSDVYFNYIGENSNNWILLLFSQVKDYIKFGFILKKEKPQIIHLNPSLDLKAVFRDAGFLVLSKIFRKVKILVYFHGWDKCLASKIDHRYSKIFKVIYGLSDAFCVLSNEFKIKLQQWGIDKPIYLVTTKVDDALLKNYQREGRSNHSFNILFLARIQKDKGIYCTTDIYEILKNKYDQCSLLIAGDGPELRNVMDYVKEKDLQDVRFLGYIREDEKISVLKNSSCYILPTTHGEGMPTSVLEALAFGIPVVTRPVGGINNFFEHGRMGFLVESLNPQDYVGYIERLIVDEGLWKKMSRFNHEYAVQHFLASKVAARLEEIYQNLLQLK